MQRTCWGTQEGASNRRVSDLTVWEHPSYRTGEAEFEVDGPQRQRPGSMNMYGPENRLLWLKGLKGPEWQGLRLEGKTN